MSWEFCEWWMNETKISKYIVVFVPPIIILGIMKIHIWQRPKNTKTKQRKHYLMATLINVPSIINYCAYMLDITTKPSDELH